MEQTYRHYFELSDGSRGIAILIKQPGFFQSTSISDPYYSIQFTQNPFASDDGCSSLGGGVVTKNTESKFRPIWELSRTTKNSESETGKPEYNGSIITYTVARGEMKSESLELIILGNSDQSVLDAVADRLLIFFQSKQLPSKREYCQYTIDELIQNRSQLSSD